MTYRITPAQLAELKELVIASEARAERAEAELAEMRRKYETPKRRPRATQKENEK